MGLQHEKCLAGEPREHGLADGLAVQLLDERHATPGKRTLLEQVLPDGPAGDSSHLTVGRQTLLDREDPWTVSAQHASTLYPAALVSGSPSAFDDFLSRGLREVLSALASMRGRHGLMEATLSAAKRATRPEMPSLTVRPAPPDPDGQAMWRVTERRAATLYRHAMERGEFSTEDPAVKEALARAGGGQPLPATVRRHMELEFGISLARVRIHMDSVAASAAHAVRAKAFTVGEDIFFADGAYAPETTAGQRLLAHELTHVVQTYQGRTETGGTGIKISSPDEPLEREADAVADRIGEQRTTANAATEAAPLDDRRTRLASHETELDVFAGRSSKVLPDPRSPRMSNPAIQRAPGLPPVPPKGPAERLKIDLDDLVRVKGSDGHSFKPRDMKKEPPIKEVQLADKIAADAGDEFVFPRAKNEAAIDGFLKKSGRPVQLKTLTAAPQAQATKVVGHANDAFEKAAGWSDVDLHIEAREATIAEVQTRWNQPNRVPAVKSMPGGRITRIRVYCRDGVVDLPIPGTSGVGGVGTGGVGTGTAAAQAGRAVPHAEPKPGTRAPTPTTGAKSVAAEAVAESMSKVRSLLRGFGKGLKVFLSTKVQVPLAVVLELLNAMHMINMATSKLAGKGFILNDEIAKANALEREAASALNWYRDGYHSDLMSAIEEATTLILFGGSREMLATMQAEAPAIIDSLQQLVDSWSKLMSQIAEVEKEARSKETIAKKMLNSPEFYQLTAMSGTAVAATVFALSEDLSKIGGAAGSARSNLSTAISVAREDIAMLQYFL